MNEGLALVGCDEHVLRNGSKTLCLDSVTLVHVVVFTNHLPASPLSLLTKALCLFVCSSTFSSQTSVPLQSFTFSSVACFPDTL